MSDDSDTSMLNINGFTLIYQGKICSAHGGLAIYLSTKFSFKTLTVYENSEIWEGQFIEITGNETSKSIILGNIYTPPSNTNIICQSFIDNFVPLLETLRRKNREVIIAGDYNIDLLKINVNPTYCDYMNSVVSQSFFPAITLPTRFSNRNCTLIDNYLCKLSHGFTQSTSGILINRISDHLPYFIFLDNLKYKHIISDIRGLIWIQKWDVHCVHKFNIELNNASIYELMNTTINADPNANLNILNRIISQAKDKHLPLRYVNHLQRLNVFTSKTITRRFRSTHCSEIELEYLSITSEKTHS